MPISFSPLPRVWQRLRFRLAWATSTAAVWLVCGRPAPAQSLLELPDAPSTLLAGPSLGSTSGGGQFYAWPRKITKPAEKTESMPTRRPPPGGYPDFPSDHQQHVREELERNTDCEEHLRHGKPCRVSWPRVLGESFFFLSTQHAGNIGLDRDTRAALRAGDFWGRYVYCVDHYRWSRWKDDDPFGVDYIGHPMMGAMTSSIYEQNDPKQRALMFENTRRYWMGRLRAMAYSAAYSAQWKIGPLSEASIGNTGIGYYLRADGVVTNETGMQDFFITPIGGLAWNVGEDVIDRYIFSHIRHARRNRWLLLAASTMTPLKSAANVTRGRATYYRDSDESTAYLLRWKSE